jgi:hypothetical protein
MDWTEPLTLTGRGEPYGHCMTEGGAREGRAGGREKASEVAGHQLRRLEGTVAWRMGDVDLPEARLDAGEHRRLP